WRPRGVARAIPDDRDLAGGSRRRHGPGRWRGGVEHSAAGPPAPHPAVVADRAVVKGSGRDPHEAPARSVPLQVVAVAPALDGAVSAQSTRVMSASVDPGERAGGGNLRLRRLVVVLAAPALDDPVAPQRAGVQPAGGDLDVSANGGASRGRRSPVLIRSPAFGHTVLAQCTGVVPSRAHLRESDGGGARFRRLALLVVAPALD